MVDPMWILLLEAGVALSLFILVIWWTAKPRKKDDGNDVHDAKDVTGEDDGNGDKKE
ncbi:hypothetical protein [Nitrosovibrio sp. Nv6]|uniref:hypothetical protein n=1 Tax=Nitrosovibrio sp. Nv6 TaxID=1855340 RepID=UPI0008D71CE8|nr:hypothetical protein [Nitrosovibrio sp. Nv6]SEP24881.1 hypothetical protein SAMN05216316_2137 [Nitrosovibrio sp. Nv6]